MVSISKTEIIAICKPRITCLEGFLLFFYQKKKNGNNTFSNPGWNNAEKRRPLISLVSVQFSCLVVSNSLWPHGLQHARLHWPSPTPGACSNSCPLSQWCNPTISYYVAPFSSCRHSFPASGSSLRLHFFASGGQSIGTSASASVLPMNIQDWFPLGLTGLISLQSKGLSRVFSNTTVQKHQFGTLALSFLYSPILTSIHNYWKNHSFD